MDLARVTLTVTPCLSGTAEAIWRSGYAIFATSYERSREMPTVILLDARRNRLLASGDEPLHQQYDKGAMDFLDQYFCFAEPL
jgi:hypothetical protein